MKIFFSLFTISVMLLSFLNAATAQNLVPNYSFEIADTCPYGISSLVYSNQWYRANTGTPDYFDSCADLSSLVDVPDNFFGWQQARTGGAYAGFYAFYYYPGYREYPEVPLTSSLVTGTKYYLSFYVSLADSSVFATDDFGMYLSADSLFSFGTGNFPVTPQLENPEGTFVTDTLNWTRVAGEYIAVGGEKFLTIGNFKDGATTDSLRVRPVNISSAAPQYIHAYYYVDDVCVSSNPVECGFPSSVNKISSLVLNLKNLGGNIFSVQIPVGLKNDFQISVVNILGERCSLKIISENKNEIQFKPESVVAGIYFVQLVSGMKKYSGKIFVE
ncbi:MAG: T9SS type A sorting domain-containing protein [Bacteroidota bacterium]